MRVVQVGEITIDPVMDGTGRFAPTEAYLATGGGTRGTDPDDWAPHRDLLDADGLLALAIGGFLVRTADRVVLVDTGLGDLDTGTMRGGRLLENLAGLGVAADQVTDVILTHLHFDHVGWTTRKGAVVFENATYRCDAHDWSHFVGPDPGATKKLRPLESRLEVFDGSGPLLPGIDRLAAPGHTPGSTILVVSSGVDRAMLLGDVVHSAVELLDDEWAGMGDVDPALAQRTRVALAKELEGSDIPVAAAHFPDMVFGRLLVGQGRRSFVIG